LGADGKTIYYLTGGPIYENGDRPLYVNSIAVDTWGKIYTLARINQEGRTVPDLIKINLIA
jgi:hypothetical protein